MTAMQVIQHYEVTNPSGDATIEFSNISQDYSDLVLVASLRHGRNVLVSAISLRINNSTSGYLQRYMVGEGGASSASGYSTADAGLTVAGYVPGAQRTFGMFGNLEIVFPDYTLSSEKSFIAVSGEATTSSLVHGYWPGPAPINSIQLFDGSGGSNIQRYSSATLYGRIKGSDGTTTVS